MKHNPKYRFDCENCKFNWCCGPTCTCNLNNVPEPPLRIQKMVNESRLKVNYTIEFIGD